jgi:predicted nucleotidyltransferase
MAMDIDSVRSSLQRFADTHPVLAKYRESASIMVVGSFSAGFADEHSDVDLWVPVSDEAYEDLAADLAAEGLNADDLPPNEYEIDEIGGEYFVFPLSKLRQGIEIWDEEAVSSLQHSIIIRDPRDQVARLASEFLPVPGQVIEAKITEVHSMLRIGVYSLSLALKRFLPLDWLKTVCRIADGALQLCCWLGGDVPHRGKWLMRQANRTPTGETIVPLVLALFEAITPSVRPREAWPDPSVAPVMRAARSLEEASRAAVRRCGFAHIDAKSEPRPKPGNADLPL